MEKKGLAMTDINRDDALSLLKQYTNSESLMKHMLAVEAAMQSYARKLGEDEKLWGITGLLHDFDYEKWPNPNRDQTEHPFPGAEILRKEGYPDEMVEAILGHAEYSGVERTTKLAKILYAVDELCGFVMAAALVRPERFEGMKPKSVKKKLKDKRFAAAVSRENIQEGIQSMNDDFGIDENTHIQNVIDAMREATL
jgi:putative nucleotidyltransferase with HDIG domain